MAIVNSVTVVGAFFTSTAFEAVTLVYEDGNRPDNVFHLVGDDEEISETQTNMFVITDTADTIESAQSGSFFEQKSYNIQGSSGPRHSVDLPKGVGEVRIFLHGSHCMSHFLAIIHNPLLNNLPIFKSIKVTEVS